MTIVLFLHPEFFLRIVEYYSFFFFFSLPELAVDYKIIEDNKAGVINLVYNGQACNRNAETVWCKTQIHALLVSFGCLHCL